MSGVQGHSGDTSGTPAGMLLADAIREARERRGWSLVDAARALIDLSEQPMPDADSIVRSWKRWEHGTQPGRLYRPLVARLLDLDEHLLAARPVPAAATALDDVWTPEAAGSLLELVTHGDMALTPAVVPRLVHEWLVSEPPQLVEPRAGRRIGDRLVAQVERRVEQLRLVDDFVGGRDLHELVGRELRATIELLRASAYTDRLGRRLLAAVGELGQLAGWVSADAGLYPLAERYYAAGVRASHAAGDLPMAAHCISSLGYQVANVGNPRDGVLLARSAYEGARRAATATTRALLQERIAWAHARAGEPRQTEQALGAVEREYEQRQPADDPAWVYWLDRDEIDVMAGRCYTELRQPRRAEPLLRAVLDRYGDTRAREAALYTTWLAEDYLQTGDIDQAAATATRALTLAARINSVRSADRVAHLHDQLTRHASVQAVREFDDAYRDLAG